MEEHAYFWVSCILRSWVPCSICNPKICEDHLVQMKCPPSTHTHAQKIYMHLVSYVLYIQQGKQFLEGWFLEWSCNTPSKQDTFERQGKHKSQFCRDIVLNQGCSVWATYPFMLDSDASLIHDSFSAIYSMVSILDWMLASLPFLRNAADFSFYILTSWLISISFK